ncbi:MAG TPA: SDR family oxidoreductase [Candidatus Eisenbacteria bacterium]|nr:SDR family oxidoreductase [Candidatus Eisenbacteria bacterium]
MADRIPRRGSERGFEGRRALVIGGSRGLGRAVALDLAREGAAVLATGRDAGALRELSQSAEARGAPLRTARSDAVRRAAVRAAVRRAGPLDVLVHAPGDYWEGPLSRLSEKAWRGLVDSNLTSALLAIQEVLPGMRRRRYGRILLFGVAGSDAPRAAPRAHAYRALKTALLTIARSVAVEEAEHGITVNVILPGVIRTPDLAPSWKGAAARIPARRLGTPHEVARAALFLLSEESGYITGSALTISGGYLL